MKRFLVTGVVGSGKTTICNTLAAMGYESHDIEEIDGMFAMYKKGTGKIFEQFDNSDPEQLENAEWLCSVDKLQKLLSKQKAKSAFYCGIASNMDDITPLFDEVFLLRADPEVLRMRLATREGTYHLGGTEAGRRVVLQWKDWLEDEMAGKGAVVIDANADPQAIAKEIVAKAEVSF